MRIMNFCVVFFTILLGLTMANTKPNSTQVLFRNKGTTKSLSITFEGYSTKGLRISVENIEGLELFSLQAKINSPLRRGEEGNIKWEKLQPQEDKLVKELPDVELLIGDIINYWIRIQYRGVSLLSDNLSHILKDFASGQFQQTKLESSASYESTEVKTDYDQPPATTPRRTAQRPNQSWTTTILPPLSTANPESTHAANSPPKECSCNENELRDVWAQMNASAERMRMLEETLSPLRDKINSLTETVDELIKNLNIGTNLLLTGNLPVHTNPVEDVRYLLIEKLKLQDLSTSILQAEYKSNGIAFEVASSIDKLRILKRSKDILSKLSYQIIDPEKPPLLDVRSAK